MAQWVREFARQWGTGGEGGKELRVHGELLAVLVYWLTYTYFDANIKVLVICYKIFSKFFIGKYIVHV